jgi:hypothetical protein
MQIKVVTDYVTFSFLCDDARGLEFVCKILRSVWPVTEPVLDPAVALRDVVSAACAPDPPVRTKRKYVRHKTLGFNAKRDRVLRENFEELGVSGIFDKSLLPGFSLTEIRKRCMDLGLLDQYGLKPGVRRQHEPKD